MQTAHSNLCRGARTNKMIPTQKWWTEFLNPFSERFLLTTTQKNCEQLFNSTVLSLSAYRFWVIHDRPIHSEKETFQDQRGTLTDDGSFFFFLSLSNTFLSRPICQFDLSVENENPRGKLWNHQVSCILFLGQDSFRKGQPKTRKIYFVS